MIRSGKWTFRPAWISFCQKPMKKRRTNEKGNPYFSNRYSLSVYGLGVLRLVLGDETPEDDLILME